MDKRPWDARQPAVTALGRVPPNPVADDHPCVVPTVEPGTDKSIVPGDDAPTRGADKSVAFKISNAPRQAPDLQKCVHCSR